MHTYKILKARQPFIINDKYNDYENFQKELIHYLNSGYELIQTEDISYNYYDIEYSEKIFILRKPA